jgi:hypothetical protein
MAYLQDWKLGCEAKGEAGYSEPEATTEGSWK